MFLKKKKVLNEYNQKHCFARFLFLQKSRDLKQSLHYDERVEIRKSSEIDKRAGLRILLPEKDLRQTLHIVILFKLERHLVVVAAVTRSGHCVALSSEP